MLKSIALLFILEPTEGPTINSIIPLTANSLKVNWNKLSPSVSNGNITKYEVCYQVGSTVSNCSNNETVFGVDSTMVDLTELEPATTYAVAVRAFTKIGEGPLGAHKTAKTNESGEFICFCALDH